MSSRPALKPVLPGSEGEHALQERFGTSRRARTFYERQLLDHLNASMRRFLEAQTMVFVGTADRRGEADCSIRAGEPGFVRVLDARTIAYPEYRGNGVLASLGNLSENPHVGLLFVDFFRDTIGLHVNGTAAIVENDEMRRRPGLPEAMLADIDRTDGRRPERWVVVSIVEAYIHCSKHIPRLARVEKPIDWGTDDPAKKGGDYFGAGRPQAT